MNWCHANMLAPAPLKILRKSDMGLKALIGLMN